MKILSICPSIHPEKFIKMEESFYKTSTEHNELFEVKFGTVTEAINFSFKKYPDFDFYHVTNDDVIYQTPGWDERLIQVLDDYGSGISYGNDLFQGQNLPTFPMISREIVEAVGWLQMPTLKKYYGDSVWKNIGEELKCLYYVPEVIIEHKHFYAGKSDELPNKELEAQDMQAFAQWLVNSYKDKEKIRRVLCQK